MLNNYVRCIQSRYPDLIIDTVYLNDEGQNNDVLFINGNLIFRFPRYSHAVEALGWETVLLKHLQGKLNLAVPNPIYECLDPPEVGKAFIGYHLIPGQPLWGNTIRHIKDEQKLQHLAIQLATFLKQLHSTAPEAELTKLPKMDGIEEWHDRYQRIQGKLFHLMRPDAREAVTQHFEAYLNNPIPFTPALRHGDFGPVNILYDTYQETITGVIDFGNAGIGDPAVDLAGIISPVGYGEDFLRRFESLYPNIESMLNRARFYVGTFALQEALFGIENNDQEALKSGIADYV